MPVAKGNAVGAHPQWSHDGTVLLMHSCSQATHESTAPYREGGSDICRDLGMFGLTSRLVDRVQDRATSTGLGATQKRL